MCVCVCCFAAKKVNDTCLFVSLGSHTHTYRLITGHSLSAIVPSLSGLRAATFRHVVRAFFLFFLALKGIRVGGGMCVFVVRFGTVN